MNKVIILGAGGHCRSILSILKRDWVGSHFSILDIHSSNQTDTNETELILDVPVEKTGSNWTKKINKTDIFIIAVGDSSERKKIFEFLICNQAKTPRLISKTAIVHDSAFIEDAVVVHDLAYIGPKSIIHENTVINTAAIIEHECKIGKNNNINPRSVLCGRVETGELVTIGAGAIIRDGISISENCQIGMGAVVVKNITIPGKHFGVPARIQK